MRSPKRQSGQSPALVFRIGLSSAVHGVQAYRTTALLLGLTLVGALGAIIPLANLFGRQDDWSGFRQILNRIPGGDLGLPWLMSVASPSAAQQEAVATLGTLLLYTLWATVLVAIVTILSLGVVRAREQRTERAIRRAVGASRRTLLIAALAEVVLIAVTPVTIGGLIGLGITRVAAASWSGDLVTGSAAVTGLTVMLLLVVLVAVLVIPALSRPRRVGESEMHHALPTAPVVFQIAICFIVLCIGSLLSSRAEELWITRPDGATGGTIATISVDTDAPRERSEQFRRLLDSLDRAGMHSVSLTSPGTLSGLGHVAMVLTDCGQCSEGGLRLPVRIKPATHKIVSADTFRLVGLPVLAGRGITSADDWDAPRVAVVSRSLAAREFQDGEPIGRRIHTGDDGAEASTVVGIVDNQLPAELGGSLQPSYAVYVSALQHPPRTVDLLVRDPANHDALAKVVGTALGGSIRYTQNSELSVREAGIAPIRWFGHRFALQGSALVILALLGIAAFMRLWVESLTGEIGIRRSVGARRHQILWWVVWRAVGIAAKGVAVGVWFGAAIRSTLTTVVTGIAVWEPVHFLLYAVLLAGVVICSVVWPAWRVSWARPAELLGD